LTVRGIVNMTAIAVVEAQDRQEPAKRPGDTVRGGVAE
jgi:hypothetical protein